MSCHTDQHDAGEPGAAAGTSGDASNGGGSPRRGDAQRSTAETKIEASVCLDGTGRADVSTGLKFLDHMITSLAKHSMLDITLRAESVDGIMHHLAEDTAIVLGSAIDGALDARSGIARFGHASVPLDESLAEATIDLVRRPYARVRLLLGPRGESPAIEDMAKEDVEHFFQSLLENMASCTHLEVRYGQNDHHKAEAAIKAVAVALRQAVAADAARAGGAPSTKGSM